MSAEVLPFAPKPALGLGDVLEQLTDTYWQMTREHGPLLGFSAPPPTSPAEFEREQAKKGLLIDTAETARDKAAALLDREADRHQQIGRLAYWIAGYEIAHGSRDNAEPMQQLGNDHLTLADGIREQRLAEMAANGNSQEGSDMPRAETLSLEVIEREPWSAVLLDIPADASVSLLTTVYSVAGDLAEQHKDRARDIRENAEKLSELPTADMHDAYARKASARWQLAEQRLNALGYFEKDGDFIRASTVTTPHTQDIDAERRAALLPSFPDLKLNQETRARDYDNGRDM